MIDYNSYNITTQIRQKKRKNRKEEKNKRKTRIYKKKCFSLYDTLLDTKCFRIEL